MGIAPQLVLAEETKGYMFTVHLGCILKCLMGVRLGFQLGSLGAGAGDNRGAPGAWPGGATWHHLTRGTPMVPQAWPQGGWAKGWVLGTLLKGGPWVVDLVGTWARLTNHGRPPFQGLGWGETCTRLHKRGHKGRATTQGPQPSTSKHPRGRGLRVYDENCETTKGFGGWGQGGEEC